MKKFISQGGFLKNLSPSIDANMLFMPGFSYAVGIILCPHVSFVDANDSITFQGARAHSFNNKFKTTLPPNASQVMRIAQEVAALTTSLPLDVESAIFVRTDDAKCTLLRALIIGPEGTPYSGGCFQFDIMFPFTYPKVPPLVRFYTKAYGLFRFNPNLYSCGNVCLSLLGTWPGPESEQWHKDTSTLLQSLIFVAEPYFNEPGFEKSIGTTEGAKLSQAYNENVLLRTVQYAMVEQLRCPSSGFEDVVYTHFALKKDRILEFWVGKCKILLSIHMGLPTRLGHVETWQITSLVLHMGCTL
ncbi:hypothetical protein PR048_015109 [Dryococelus australis]|uniref:UBC core domain-containing protein n=1 Tax=Dryococelus australis TaxID=614101 RepID=A0ABQ9HGA2_9NEOP|nr:hypothetical protein PR048_015109 [Dryococelus australis]